ncbi:ribosome hibernation-promoting factor, HPF/YfiA family [Chloroflexota bacterium]
MEFVIRGKNFEVSELVRERIESKIGKLERHLPNAGKISVDLAQEKTRSANNRYVVQVTMDSNGTLLRGEERADTIDNALDSVVNVLKRQIERFKGKFYRRQRKAAQEESEPATEQQEETGNVVRVKRFPVKPMNLDEAIEQMELLGHNLFLFLDADSNNFSVIYRRGDGNYGLIEPELA